MPATGFQDSPAIRAIVVVSQQARTEAGKSACNENKFNFPIVCAAGFAKVAIAINSGIKLD
jgi:hypothetical protein